MCWSKFRVAFLRQFYISIPSQTVSSIIKVQISLKFPLIVLLKVRNCSHPISQRTAYYRVRYITYLILAIVQLQYLTPSLCSFPLQRYHICGYHAALPEFVLDGHIVRFCQVIIIIIKNALLRVWGSNIYHFILGVRL